ncbi:ABC transporter permease [Mariniluteicoccus flavus]
MVMQNPEVLATTADAENDPGPLGPVPPKRRPGGRLRLYVRRFFRNRMACVGVVIFLLLVLYSLVGQMLTKFGPTDTDFMALGEPPGPVHWFGTNDAGNDVFVQSVYGLRRSLMIALTVSLSVTVISAIIGSLAAFFGGRIEKVILNIINFLLILPTFLILALLSSKTSGQWQILVIILIATGWMYQARVVWSLATSLRERDYVTAARFMGVPALTNVVRHIIPNIGSLLVINFALGVITTVMAETGLSFLGFGVKIPDVSLGTLLGEGVASVYVSPWLFYVPAGIVTLLTVSMAFISDGLRDALDPNSAAGGRA